MANHNRKEPENLLNKRFDKLEVIEYVGRDDEKRLHLWKCKCDCGNIVIRNNSTLKKSGTHTCGCRPKKEVEDLLNQKFDRLKVIRYVGRDNKRRVHLWECECDCGEIVVRDHRTLKKNTPHSCGCHLLKHLVEGNSERCSIAGKAKAEKYYADGINMEALDNTKNISTNTSGHKGITWSKTARKWHVFIGYKNYRCNLAYVEDMRDAIMIRDKAYEAIKDGTFEDFYYRLRGHRIEDKLTKSVKKRRKKDEEKL